MAKENKKTKAKEVGNRSPTGGRGKPRLLKSEALVLAAQAMLGRWTNLSPKTHPINVSRLAVALVVSRQALLNNGFSKETLAEYATLQQKNFSGGEEKIARRSDEERIASQEKMLEEFRRKLDGWIERWATVEYNAKIHGIDVDKILLTRMPPPDRERIRAVGGRKDMDDDED